MKHCVTCEADARSRGAVQNTRNYDFMGDVESLSRVIEKMSFSAQSKQTRVTDYFSRELASGGSA